MKIKMLELIEGAKQAEGLTVIIDVLRAFSLECYLFQSGASKIIPIGNIDKAYEMKRENPDYILVGERGGKMCEGFDYGNSPSAFEHVSLNGKTIIHTTSAGTQGIANATGATEIISGSLVNAKAVAEYIRRKNPEVVSIVAMGNGGVREAKEDVVCAKYIKSMLDGTAYDIVSEVAKLQFDGGQHFFNPDTQDVFPEPDFWLCMKYDRFPFVLQLNQDKNGQNYMKKIMVG